MVTGIKQVANDQLHLPSDTLSSDIQKLAFDALSNLAKQFSRKPDFHNLMEVFILILSGQFSVTSAFVIIQQISAHPEDQLFFSIGKRSNSKDLVNIKLSKDLATYFLNNNAPQRVDKMDLSGTLASLILVLKNNHIKLVAPLIHNDNLLGLVGLGEKVNKKPFADAELELLAALINAVTPLISNSFLFMEIANLNAWYLEVLNNVEQGVFVFDSDNLLKAINKTGFDILKTFRSDLPDIKQLKDHPIETIFPAAVFPDWGYQLNRARSEKLDKLTINLTAKQDDRDFIYRAHVRSIFRENEYRSDLIITLVDITFQRENEQRLFDLQKFAEKGLLASSISHELNNFLGMILGGLEMIEFALNENDSEKVNATLEQLKTAVDQMTRFTAGLMDYGKLSTSKRKANLNNLIVDVLSFVSVQKKFKSILIHTELDKNIPEFEMDTDQISQLLLNLLNNAADAIEEVKNGEGWILVKTVKESNFVNLSVSDNGVGIEPDIKEKLFKAHLTTKVNGHGYGLITCAVISENHHAHIEIDSEPGQGATFSIRFPIDTID